MEINPLVDKIVLLARAEAPASVEVAFEPGDGIPSLRADEGQVGQILKNLLKNALEALGDGPGRVGVGTARHGIFVEVRVEDNGPGIPAGEWERIFAPYHTTKAEGSGLGLPLSRQIAQLHGGRLAVEEGEEGGACLILDLPLDGPAGEVGTDG